MNDFKATEQIVQIIYKDLKAAGALDKIKISPQSDKKKKQKEKS